METKQERLVAITGMQSETISLVMKGFHDSPHKKVVAGLIKLSIEEVRSKIETCTPDQLTTLQGQIKGMRTVLGTLNFEMPKEDR